VVTLSVSAEQDLIAKYLESLPELFIVAEVDILTNSDRTSLTVERSQRTKCDRCWRYTADVGHNKNYPTVCLRCAQALDAIDFAPYASTSN